MSYFKYLSVLLLLSTWLLIVKPCLGDTYVRGYVKKNGTYVAPHFRSSPNRTTLDNWSTKGNINPYTGKIGSKNIYDGLLHITKPLKTTSLSNQRLSNQSATIGIVSKDVNNKISFNKTHYVPNIVGTSIMWLVPYSSINLVEVTHVITAPSATVWSKSYSISNDGRTATSKYNIIPINNLIYGGMSLNKHDPIGKYKIDVLVNGVLLKEFFLSVYNANRQQENNLLSQVDIAENQENLRTCLNGNYPNLCKKNLLNETELKQAYEAERKVNLKTCLNGNYPNLCKKNLLNETELKQALEAEWQVNRRICLDGKYPNLCNRQLLVSKPRD
jgi:hypothetical protein